MSESQTSRMVMLCKRCELGLTPQEWEHTVLPETPERYCWECPSCGRKLIAPLTTQLSYTAAEFQQLEQFEVWMNSIVSNIDNVSIFRPQTTKRVWRRIQYDMRSLLTNTLSRFALRPGEKFKDTEEAPLGDETLIDTEEQLRTFWADICQSTKPEKIITEDQFWADYVPIQNHLIPEDEDGLAWDGCLFETLRPDLDYIREQNEQRPEHIWTLLEVDDGLVISSGMHYVNRVGFFVTEKPWTETTATEVLEGQNP